ncbi:MAG TPA: oligosaccharide flippase family protein [Silvibacterium sp.]|nr:oligosaccharide flippase family protein [Silvibacterium sp.]
MREEPILKGSLWIVSGQFVSMALQAVYFVLMGRTLGSREYGAFVGIVSLIALLAQFSSLGMEMVLLRNVSRDPKSFPSTWGSALRITTSGFVILLAVASLFGHFALRPELRVLIPWIAVSDALFGKLVQLSSRVFQAAGQMRYCAKLSTSVYAGRAILAGALLLYTHRTGAHADAHMWVRIYWLSPFAVAVVACWMVTAKLGWPRFEPLRLRDLSEGLSFSFSSSSISAYNDIDKTFLVSLGQTYAAGIYSAAYRVIDAATAPLYGIYTAATPRLFREGARSVAHASAHTRKLLLRTVPYGIAVAIGLYCGAGLLPRLFGSSFQDSVAALRWLCLLPLFRVLHYAWGTAITASVSQWNRTTIQIGAALVNLLLNFLLIPRWSWQGAAVASLITDGSLAISSRLVLWHIQRRERLSGQQRPVLATSALD